MTHLDEGMLVALRDGALVPADYRTHVDACRHCTDALLASERRAILIADSLRARETAVDVERAKAIVRRRLDGHRATQEPRGLRRLGIGPLGRAAGILLLGASAAYALPGSPVPGWIGRDTESTSSHAGATAAQEVIANGGIEVALQAGHITIALSGVRDGDEVTVHWIDEPVARIAAGAGSLYGFAEGKAEAVVSAGPIAVEVSRAATSVTVQVNGRTVLRGTATNPVLDAGVVSRTSDRIVLSFVER